MDIPRLKLTHMSMINMLLNIKILFSLSITAFVLLIYALLVILIPKEVIFSSFFRVYC